MSTTVNIGHVSAYALAVEGGYTGTEEEFEALMASYAEVAEEAEGHAEDAEAWAVGQRGGEDVDSDDETYHNNAKYYAELAQGYAAPESWDEIRASVRAGEIGLWLSAGDQCAVGENGLITASVGDSTGITAVSVDNDTFLDAVGSDNAVYVFTYNGSNWYYGSTAVDLANYGITVTGTAAADDEITVQYSATDADYDVEGIDEEEPANTAYEHVLSLVRNQCLGLLRFDPPQYLFAVTADSLSDLGISGSVLPAGTYNVTLLYGAYDNSTTQDGTYEFTTTADIPIGGGIRHTTMGCWYSSSSDYTVAKITGGTFTTYGSDGLTVLESGLTCTEGSSGTNLGITTARDPSYKSGDYINFTQRQYYGSNRWSTSWIRQVLNSDEDTLTFSPGTIWSRPDTSSIAGFLSQLDPELVAVLGKVKKRYALSIADGYGYEDIEDTVTLCTMLDIFGSQNNSIYEGPVDSSDAVTRTTAKSLWKDVLTEAADRIKYYNNSARIWWLSSSYPSVANNERYVLTSGALNYNVASSSYGVVPVLHII